ncbi:unnamed protein product [Penicillium salamii]|nr:unnamed protein product [Penicillium salamii]CAG8367113.1 unnamed protein product [Penicillium salamii]
MNPQSFRERKSRWVKKKEISKSSWMTSAVLTNFHSSLTRIMGDTIERLYDQNLGLRPHLSMTESINQISALRCELNKWRGNISSCLQIVTSQDPLNDGHFTVDKIDNTRFNILLSLRYFEARMLILRPLLGHYLDLPGRPASNAHQPNGLLNTEAHLLSDIVRTCGDILRISKNLMTGSRKNKSLLGAWWFALFNSCLAILGILLIKKVSAYSKQASSFSESELTRLIRKALDVICHTKDGSETMMRCRDTLVTLISGFDFHSKYTHAFLDTIYD